LIISRSSNFIFFKPLKVAGSSIEAALSKTCNDTDIYTGSSFKEEHSANFHDPSPKNNWKEPEVLVGEDAFLYLKRHGHESLWDKGKKTLNLLNPIYTSHESPKMLIDSGFNIENFKTISVVRNPFDMLVSYFWYSFDASDTFLEGKKNKKRREEALKSTLRPHSSDSLEQLKLKFNTFFNLPAVFNRDDREDNPHQDVFEWFADWQNEFYEYDLDYVIKFENLQEDYDFVCSSLSLDSYRLPNFKTAQRKFVTNFMDLFSEKLKERTLEKYSSTFEKFGYNLN
jgi:hypothetical protein